MIKRRSVRPVTIKDKQFGKGAILIQSMLSCPSYDLEGNVKQAKALERAGCDILRLAIPDKSAISLIEAIKKETSIPLVADIHFDHNLALEAVKAGIDKIRINPGNIGSDDAVKKVAHACKTAGIPIRIGVNSGSIEKSILAKFGGPTPEAMVESAKYHASLLEKYDFDQIVISLKASHVCTTIEAYEKMATCSDYPLHLGVTEAGTERMGLIKSSIGIGSLLAKGIGDTIRVSLTGDPLLEVKAAKDILKALDLHSDGVTLISCPTCGRTRIDVVSLANTLEEKLSSLDTKAKKPKKLTVAVMGCVVNGPGEAKEADLGIAGGDGCAVLFSKGIIQKKIREDEILPTLLKEIERLSEEDDE